MQRVSGKYRGALDMGGKKSKYRKQQEESRTTLCKKKGKRLGRVTGIITVDKYLATALSIARVAL